MSTQSVTPDSVFLSIEQISQIEAQYPGAGEMIARFKQEASDAQQSQAPKTATEPVNEYTDLALEHSEFIKDHNSVEIATWL